MCTDIKNRGYTIIEIMIFLAVSGFMFLMAAIFINGKQSSAQFKQGMNDINSKVQSVINDVSNGFYPGINSFSCDADSLGDRPYFTTPSSAPQGSNLNCVFIGKVLQFNAGGDPTAYNIYTIAGRQYVKDFSDGAIPTSFQQAKPVVVYDTIDGTTSPNFFDLTSKDNLSWGLQYKSMNDNGTAISAVGFFQNFGSYDTSSGNLQSGAQDTLVVDMPINNGEPETQVVTDFGAGSYDASMDSGIKNNPDITVCFQGGSSQYGALYIGGGAGKGQRLSSHIQISNNLPPGC